MTTAHVSIAAIVICVAIEAAILVPPFLLDLRRAGGWRNLLAELLQETAPSPALPALRSPRPAVPWWDRADAGLPARTYAACWEPADRADVSGVPPWAANAPSQGTGYTRWHAEDLNKVLGQEAS